MQIYFWFYTNNIQPYVEIVPTPPGPVAMQALSFGDMQFYFRSKALMLQNLGDGYRRISPLENYNYSKIKLWMESLDTLDHYSHFTPAIACYYYAMTQNTTDIRYILEYLKKHVIGQEAEKWWWITQGVYLAKHRLGDNYLALEFAQILVETSNIPIWARELAAFLYEDLGEKEQAYRVISYLKNHVKDLSQGEINFMHYFIKDRLKLLTTRDDK